MAQLPAVAFHALAGVRVVRCAGSIAGSPFVVSDCTDSDIYLLDACGPGRLRGLKRCRLILGACAGLVAIEDCSQCVIAVASLALQISRSERLAVRALVNSDPMVTACSGVATGAWRRASAARTCIRERTFVFLGTARRGGTPTRAGPFSVAFEGLDAALAMAGVDPRDARWRASGAEAIGTDLQVRAWGYVFPYARPIGLMHIRMRPAGRRRVCLARGARRTVDHVRPVRPRRRRRVVRARGERLPTRHWGRGVS